MPVDGRRSLTLRDCGIGAFVIVGVALEIGIQPTVRHATDVGYIPVVVTDACGSRDRAAAARSLATLAFAGGSLQADGATLVAALGRSGGSPCPGGLGHAGPEGRARPRTHKENGHAPDTP